MSLPDLDDLRWRELVAGRKRYQLQNLATQMLVTRLRIRTRAGDENVIAVAIETALQFFERNAATTAADASQIFGEEP